MLEMLLAFLLIGECVTGTLSQYDQQPTDETLLNRTTPGRTAHTLPAGWQGVDGYMAVLDCRDIGNIYLVTWGEHSARIMAYDCAGSTAAKRWMQRNNVLGELDYYTARAWKAAPGRGLTKAMVCHAGRNPI